MARSRNESTEACQKNRRKRKEGKELSPFSSSLCLPAVIRFFISHRHLDFPLLPPLVHPAGSVFGIDHVSGMTEP